jgi:hypothetical protein
MYRTKYLLSLVALAALFIVASATAVACGTSSVNIDARDASPESDSGSFDRDASVGDAALPNDSASGDASAMTDGGELSTLTCGQLSAAYSTELMASKVCMPNSLVNECTLEREEILGCGCLTFVNANRTTSLDKIVDRYGLKQCIANCPAAPCVVAAGGICVAKGSEGVCSNAFR